MFNTMSAWRMICILSANIAASADKCLTLIVNRSPARVFKPVNPAARTLSVSIPRMIFISTVLV